MAKHRRTVTMQNTPVTHRYVDPTLARCTDESLIDYVGPNRPICPRHAPKAYARLGSKHRAPKHLNTTTPTDWFSAALCIYEAGYCDGRDGLCPAHSTTDSPYVGVHI